jgi:hypothetical protein
MCLYKVMEQVEVQQHKWMTFGGAYAVLSGDISPEAEFMFSLCATQMS